MALALEEGAFQRVHRDAPFALGQACRVPPSLVGALDVPGGEVGAAAEALGQTQGAAEEQDACRLDLGAEYAQIHTPWLLVRPAHGRGQLEEGLRQDLELQAAHEGNDRLHSHGEGHLDTLLDGLLPEVEGVTLPLVHVVLHPRIVAGHCPGFQLQEVVLFVDLPIGFAHSVAVPGLGSKGEARAGVCLSAGELGKELGGVHVAATHSIGDGTIRVGFLGRVGLHSSQLPMKVAARRHVPRVRLDHQVCALVVQQRGLASSRELRRGGRLYQRGSLLHSLLHNRRSHLGKNLDDLGEDIPHLSQVVERGHRLDYLAADAHDETLRGVRVDAVS